MASGFVSCSFLSALRAVFDIVQVQTLSLQDIDWQVPPPVHVFLQFLAMALQSAPS